MKKIYFEADGKTIVLKKMNFEQINEFLNCYLEDEFQTNSFMKVFSKLIEEPEEKSEILKELFIEKPELGIELTNYYLGVIDQKNRVKIKEA